MIRTILLLLMLIMSVNNGEIRYVSIINGDMSVIRIEAQIFTWNQKLWGENCKKFNINYNYCFYHQYYEDLLEREKEKEKYKRNRYKNEKKHKKINNRSKYFNKKMNFFKYKKPSKHY